MVFEKGDHRTRPRSDTAKANEKCCDVATPKACGLAVMAFIACMAFMAFMAFIAGAAAARVKSPDVVVCHS
jgi:hypothetical protein